jgi:hypothetical protein
MSTPPSRIKCSGSPSCRRRCGARLSWQGRRRGGDLVLDFCSSFSPASRRRRLQRRREEGGCCAGASDAGLLRLAVGWRMPWSVLGRWSADGGSGDALRCLRREGPDLEVEGELGAGPRPACHSDMWAPWVLLLVVHKAGWRWSFFNLGYGGLRLSTLDVVVEAFTSVSVFVVGSEHLLHASCMKTIRTRTD